MPHRRCACCPPLQVHAQVEQRQAAEAQAECPAAAAARQGVLARAAGCGSQRLMANFYAEGKPRYHLIKHR